VPFENETHYSTCVGDPEQFRRHVMTVFSKHPELFPLGFADGFTFHDCTRSRKLDLRLRRIKLTSTKTVFLVRPSLVMPYMAGRTDEVEKALYLRQWAVPFDALAYLYGRNPMYWYRACRSLGRHSIVGTTVKDAATLPSHLIVDEKHTTLEGTKVYVPTTAAAGVFLGVSVVEAAGTEDLTAGYGEFAEEARALAPGYAPETICADGWEPTRSAWLSLFPTVTIVLCFLHSILKVRDRCRRDARQRSLLLEKLWHVYEAATRCEFSQRLRRVREWAERALPGGGVREAVLKTCAKGERFAVAYAHPKAARTSNGVDRLMNYQDRVLYTMRYFHGTRASAKLMMRSAALIWNFHPYGARTRRRDRTRRSPFYDLNGVEYHKNWLHNLLIAGSLGGRPR